MKIFLMLLSIPVAVFCNAQKTQNKFAIAIHGGAGYIQKQSLSQEQQNAYLNGLNEALEAGYAVLKNNGTALDAVEAAVKLLENNPLFNAGKGAVLTHDGTVELDASIMDGSNLKAGAVAGITTIKNPITAARAVMDKSEHVFMIGKGAEAFARLMKCEMVNPEYFLTEQRIRSLEQAKKSDSLKKQKSNTFLSPAEKNFKIGTVGAVALDKNGNLAAATSTGGMTNKKFGRVGDVAVIGAGTYANNNTCAVSCTGWGEYFIRLVMAKTVSDKMEYQKMKLKDAAADMIMNQLPALGGDGGLIAIDKEGNISMVFSTTSMFRAFKTADGKKEITF